MGLHWVRPPKTEDLKKFRSSVEENKNKMEQIFEALKTGGGMLWQALWALIFGYIISAAIQILVTREQMADVLGARGAKQASLASFFGLFRRLARSQRLPRFDPCLPRALIRPMH